MCNEFGIVPDSFLTVTNHGYASLMNLPGFIASRRGSSQGKWWRKRSPQCGILVEQSQSFHRFSARWKNCCKRGNLNTKNHLYRRLNRYMAMEMDCPAVLLAQNPHAHRKRCRTRCFDSTMFHIVHG